MVSEQPFNQLKLYFRDPVQADYEAIRPVVLDAQPVAERSREIDMPPSTLGHKAQKFMTEGILGLLDRRQYPAPKKREPYPEMIAQHILFIKQLYPPLHYREIVVILARKFGYKTNHHTVKAFLSKNPIPFQMDLNLESFPIFEEAYKVRWQVVGLYHEGWSKKSIAGLLKLSHTHVGRILKRFALQGYEGLEDKRTRPATHPQNQLSLPFLEEVFHLQETHPQAGRFRIHGLLEQKLGDATPSERTVGRAMAFNRVLHRLPSPSDSQEEDTTVKSFPYHPRYRHQYWFIDIRYLVKLNRQWTYSICIVEGYSRKILAGLVTTTQDELAILQLLHAALNEYGCPWGIVSDHGSVFTAQAYEDVLGRLTITPCYIEYRKPWQNLIETQFRIQSRLSDANFAQATDLEELQGHHASFIHLFNTTNHWAHRQRPDGCTTPVTVLGWAQGQLVEPTHLKNAFRHLQFSRLINRSGYVSVQRFYIYAAQGLSKNRVSVWIYEDYLHIQYRQQLLARYRCKLVKGRKRLKSITQPIIYPSSLPTPQIALFELDHQQWLKVLKRDPFASPKSKTPINWKQLTWLPCILFCLLLHP